MVRKTAGGFWSHPRACARNGRLWPRSVAAALVLFSLTFAFPGRAAEPVKGEATFAAVDGYARLVFKLAADVGTEGTAAGSLLVIYFTRLVHMPVERLSEAMPDYVSAALRDPDGTAIRLSLVRKVTI